MQVFVGFPWLVLPFGVGHARVELGLRTRRGVGAADGRVSRACGLPGRSAADRRRIHHDPISGIPTPRLRGADTSRRGHPARRGDTPSRLGTPLPLGTPSRCLVALPEPHHAVTGHEGCDLLDLGDLHVEPAAVEIRFRQRLANMGVMEARRAGRLAVRRCRRVDAYSRRVALRSLEDDPRSARHPWTSTIRLSRTVNTLATSIRTVWACRDSLPNSCSALDGS